MLECTLDGRSVSPRAFLRRTMNFGRPVPALAEHRYAVRIDAEGLSRLLTAPYDRCMRELVEDEPYDDGTDALVNALRTSGFAPFARAVRDTPALVADVLRKLLALEALDALFPHALEEASRPYYWLNTLERVAVDASGALFEGAAYEGGATSPTGATT